MEGEGQVNRLLNKDIAIRTISIMFAVLLWFYSLNVENPFENKTISVPLKTNESVLKDKNMELLNTDFVKNIDVTIKGRKEWLEKITSNDFEASLDFSEINDKGNIYVAIKGPEYIGKEEISIIEVKPKKINLKLESIIKKNFTVEIVTSGEMKEGYKAVNISSSPKEIWVQDRASIVNSIDSAKVYISIENLDRDISGLKDIKLLDKDGKEVSELKESFNSEVAVETAKEVPVLPAITGNPNVDYFELYREVKPDKVLLTGNHDSIAEIDNIYTENINIEDIRSDFSQTALLNLPEGIKSYESVKEIVVNVFLGKYVTQEFSIKKEYIDITNAKIDETLKYEIITDNIPVMVKGKKDVIDQMSATNLLANIDVDGLNEGIYTIPLKLRSRSDVRILGEYNVKVNILKNKLVTPTPNPTSVKPTPVPIATPTPTPMPTPTPAVSNSNGDSLVSDINNSNLP